MRTYKIYELPEESKKAAIEEIKNSYRDKKLIDDESYYTVKWMKDRVLNG